MKILLTGATGYIGKRLLPVLVNQGHQVVCCVRDINRFNPANSIRDKIEIIENDLTRRDSLYNIPADIEFAYYLVHSMSAASDFDALEKLSAINFREALQTTKVKQVVYLSGIVNSQTLSKHLQSRKTVEDELAQGTYALTTIRAGIIIGSGSASFEIIRDVVEKLPVMIAPRWLNTRCQPIAIRDVIQFLTGVLGNKLTYRQSFDVSGDDILTYKEMLLEFARVRGLKRYIRIIPIMTPRLSSYWLYFVTSTSYKLAVALVDSMKIEVVAKDQRLNDMLGIQPLSYQEAITKAFEKIEQNEIVSSWKDSTVSGRLNYQISDFINVPKFGCYRDIRRKPIRDLSTCIEKIWRIGGENGWYFGDWLWQIRGFLDELFWGVGLRRGRTSVDKIQAGDTLDFWRVLYANKSEGRLLLFAEMKIPGEAWLEFRVEGHELLQIATFRPKGVLGRMYWAMVYPFHGYIFSGLLARLTE